MEDGEVVDSTRKTGHYSVTENSTAPKFTKYDNMHRVIAKPAGNMLKLKCAAEGKTTVHEKLELSNRRFLDD